MSIEYPYPRLSENWDLWVMTMNIELNLGKKPEYISGSPTEVTIAFKDVLTDDEKRKLDTIMTDVNVGLLPSHKDIAEYYKLLGTHTVFKVKDIWDYRGIIENAIGKKVKYFFILPTLPDGTHVMELWVEGKLTPMQKKKVKEAYASLISEG